MGILMILSRAIFIGRKRISFLALLLFIALSSYASEYRIAVVIDAESSVPYVEDFESYLEFSSRVVMNDSLSDAAKKRDEELLEIEYEKAVARAYREERDVSSVRRDSLASSTYEGEIVNLELSDEDISFLLACDEAALSYVIRTNDLDELYIIRVRDDDSLSFVEIFLNGELLFRFIYSEYVESDAESEILRYMVLRYRGGHSALARISGNTMPSVSVDGSDAERFNSYLILPMGLRHLELRSPSYLPLEMDVMVDSSLEEISYEMEEVRTLPLFISTIPYTDEIYYQGERVYGSYVSETTYPFSLIVSHEGFEPRSLQSDIGEHSIVTTLLATELHDPERVEVKKGEFYTHLLITLLTYGSSIAIDVVSDIYDFDLAPVSVLAKGVSVVELIRTLTALFEYRDAINYGI